MPSDAKMHAYYERDRERDRLARGIGRIEFDRTIEIIQRTLPPAPATIADIGGGPGRYTDWLVAAGYHVIHRDPVSHHVEQVRERHRDGVDTAVGDARTLDLADSTVDAVLMLGPLYHLVDVSDRRVAIAESVRITRPGGMVYAAAITRWAARIQGILVDRLYVEFPGVIDRIADVEATGLLPAVVDGGFTGYGHTPEQLRTEMVHEHLEFDALLAVEGVAAMLSDVDIDARFDDGTDYTVLLACLRALEAIPDLLGVSGHLLAVARRVGSPLVC